MQDNPQSFGQNIQDQNTQYDDQVTTPVPQGARSATLSHDQAPGTVPPAAVSQKKRAVSPKLVIVGAVVLVLLILGIAGFVLLPKLTAPASDQKAASTPAASTPAARNVYAPYLAQYRGTIRSQIAQGLHLSDTQLEDQLGSGKTLSSIATDQKISNSQLQTLVTNAFQNGFQPAVSGGNLTQKQVDALVKRML
nr:hypothetical protein [Ktedonobacteraceae bacterium]